MSPPSLARTAIGRFLIGKPRSPGRGCAPARGGAGAYGGTGRGTGASRDRGSIGSPVAVGGRLVRHPCTACLVDGIAAGRGRGDLARRTVDHEDRSAELLAILEHTAETGLGSA